MSKDIEFISLAKNGLKNGSHLDQKTGSALDKLAQLPTEKHQVVDLQHIKKRARSKYYTQQIVYPLLYQDSPLHKYYSHAYRCCDTIIQKGNKLTSRYCNSRICNVCNRIRTAKMINGYVNPLKALGSLQFTTLTIPNVEVSQINEVVQIMLKTISNIIRVIRERKGMDVSGIRKIEITYNHRTNTLHPHIHLLHNNQEVGELFISEWLKRYPNAVRQAQNTKEADENSLNEIFKYTAKFILKDDKDRKTLKVFVPILDRILIALSNKRTIQPFGKLKKLEVNEDEILKDLQAQEIENTNTDVGEYVWAEGENNIWDWCKVVYHIETEDIEAIITTSIDPNNRLANYEKPDIKFTYYF
jgi:hypothetical protein